MNGFFQELKRRKVYRVAAAYVVVAGGIIQLASATFPAWDLPNWTLRLVVVLLLLGFPIALIFAWAFDLTASGIQTTRSVAPASGGISRQRKRNIFLLIGSGLVIAIAAGFFVLPRVAAHKIDKSIAVLPFESYSDDKQNTYFADGIQDDILTSLSKIGDLKVISRTSVMGYRDRNQNVREIGKALGASAILEGSVRTDQANHRVRVNVQLINAETDEHIWANEYDRDLTDVFAIQSDLAQKIAHELQAKLSPNEKAQLTQRPTDNGEAYLAFVQARNLFVPEDYPKQQQAEQLYQRALDLDPNFALATAGYSQVESWIYHTRDATAARADRARSLADKALQLQPNLPEGHLARGFVNYYCDNNFEAAEKEFAIAQTGLPNDSDVHLALGAIQRRRGRWAESSANLEKAASLNPKSTWPLQNLSFNYEMLRDFDRAIQTVDRALKIDPENFSLQSLRAKFHVLQNGDLTEARRVVAQIEKMPPGEIKLGAISEVKIPLLLVERKFQEALETIQALPDDLLRDHAEALANKYVTSGILRTVLKDPAGARADLLRGQALIEQRLKENPASADAHLHLGYACAYLQENGRAAAEAERAMQALPESKDAFNGPDVTEAAAKIYAHIGDPDRALDLVGGLLQRPGALTVAMLRIDPEWDPLRSDPRFQQLLASNDRQPNQ